MHNFWQNRLIPPKQPCLVTNFTYGIYITELPSQSQINHANSGRNVSFLQHHRHSAMKVMVFAAFLLRAR
jgi:hypothetical protein